MSNCSSNPAAFKVFSRTVLAIFASLCLYGCAEKSETIVKRGTLQYRPIDESVVRRGAALYYAVYSELIDCVQYPTKRQEHADRACSNAKAYNSMMSGAGEDELSLLVSILAKEHPDMMARIQADTEVFRAEYTKDRNFKKTYDFCIEKLNAAQ